GVEVEHAKTSAEYLQRLAAGGFDAIISDSSMPGAEGMTALHLARERHPNIPFIYLSGAEDPNRDQRGLEALGVSGLLTKARLDELSPTLQRSVESSRENPDSGLTDRYELLIDAVRELSLARDLPAIMAIVRHAARRLTGADGATFVLREGDLCHYADEDAIGPLWKGRKFPMNSCISGWAMKNRQPAVVEDIHSDPRISLASYESTSVRRMVMVPIRGMARIGAIGSYWSRQRLPQAHEVRLLQALADSTAVAMENVRMYELLESRVRERTADLEAFTTALSYDLRTPIRHASGYASILMEDHGAILPADARQRLQTVIDLVGETGRMVDGLLKLSQTARAPVARQSLDLSQVAHDVAAQCRVRAARYVDFVAPASLPAAGDHTLRRIAFQNRLENAWKFSSKQEAPRVEFGVQSHPDRGPVYFVRDNGAGFDEEQ